MANGVDHDVQFFFIDLLHVSAVSSILPGSISYLVRPIDVLNGNFPLSFLGIPFRLLYFLPCAKILVDIVLACNSLPVVSNLLSLGKLFRPLGIRRDIGLVDMCRNVTTNTRVCILKPV